MTDPTQALLDLLGKTQATELDCDEVQTLLAAYVEGTVTAQEATLIAHHMGVCPECAEELAILRVALAPSDDPSP